MYARFYVGSTTGNINLITYTDETRNIHSNNIEEFSLEQQCRWRHITSWERDETADVSVSSVDFEARCEGRFDVLAEDHYYSIISQTLDIKNQL